MVQDFFVCVMSLFTVCIMSLFTIYCLCLLYISFLCLLSVSCLRSRGVSLFCFYYYFSKTQTHTHTHAHTHAYTHTPLTPPPPPPPLQKKNKKTINETILMITHNECFCGERRKILTFLIQSFDTLLYSASEKVLSTCIFEQLWPRSALAKFKPGHDPHF